MKLFSALRYLKGYWGFAILNMLFNILFSFFSLFSLVLIKPFLDLLFEKDPTVYTGILKTGLPPFRLSTSWFNEFFNYTVADLIQDHGKYGALMMICIAVVVLTLVKNVFRYFAMFVLAPIRNGVVRDLRNKMMRKVLDLPLSYFSEERKGDIMSRMTADVTEIEWSIMQSLEMIFREPVVILLSLITLISISPYLTLFVFLLLPFAGLIVALIGKTIKRNAAKGKAMLGGLFSQMEETLGGLKIIKAFTGEKFMINKFEKLNQDFFRISVKIYRKTDLSSPLSEVVVTAILMLIMFIGGNMALSGETGFTPSEFIMYIAVASQIVPPIKQITIAYNNIQKGVASEERIEKIIGAENTVVEAGNAIEVMSFEKQLSIQNLSFAYTKGDEGYVLKNIFLDIPKGKTIALVGQSGSGKTTLADMIPRFYDPSSGCVLLDGVDIRNIKISNLRALMGIVSQESVLFNDTIFNNIAFGLEGVSEADVVEAAKVANAHEFILQMPAGYQTNIGDRGSKLSIKLLLNDKN